MNLKKMLWILSVITAVLLYAQQKNNNQIEKFMKDAAKDLDVAVSDLKIEKEDLDFYGYGKFRIKLFDQFIYNPLKIDPFIKIFSRTVLDNADSLWVISYFPWARIDEGVRRGLIQRPENILLDSFLKNIEIKKELCILLNQFFAAEIPDTESLSETLCLGIFLLLSEIKNSIEWIDSGNAFLNEKEIDTVINELIESGEDGLSNPNIEKLIEKTDFKALSAGAMDLAYILEFGIELMRDISIKKSITVDTKFGRIVLGSADKDEYEPITYLLIIDFGGNDIYKSGGVSDKEHPVSIIIDYSGNDRYISEIGCGTGIAGYGIVIDCDGNDTYSAKKFGLGTGIFGQGIILDFSGDDEYTTDIYGIGAGLFGTGVVSDISGNDKYIGFQGCQGFGFVKGCGLLIDKNGNDTYIARDDTVKYPSAQTEEHNVSLTQGTGFGIRADFTDGHSLAGGVGMLIDGDGDDKYSCGVFGQGCGYWFGTGILIDYQGNDEYNGVWYVQGAGAHFALGILIDSTGSDRYIATKNMAQGAGHDFTLGFLLDYEGDDFHDAPNLSLGAGNANGMGLFMDFSGDDEYTTHNGITLGRANTDSRGGLRDFMKTIGIFIDGAGKDKYSEPIGANKKIWRQKPPLQPLLKTEWCIGIDY